MNKEGNMNSNEAGRRKLRPIVVRGGGDLATGTIWMLSKAGYPVIVLECASPTAIRREAAFSEAVFLGEKTVEGITCVLAETAAEAFQNALPGRPQMLVDEKAASLEVIRPEILIDAVIAKRNIGTRIDMADLVIALGPGFEAGRDAHAVIETMRGHDLGRILYSGTALPNTGTPGMICGYGKERVIHSPASGILKTFHKIGDEVSLGETIACIRNGEKETKVKASLTGILRGILPDGFKVPAGMKMADIDPRLSEKKNCFAISDKSRCIAGSVLMLAVQHMNGQRKGE